MHSDHFSSQNLLPGLFDNQSNQTENPFLDKPFYKTFLERTGLVEVFDSSRYMIVHQDKNNMPIDLDDVAEALLESQRQSDIKSSEVLSMLRFVVDTMDRNKAIPSFIRTFMCRDAITRIVLQRFKEATGGFYANLTELSYKISDNIDEANEIFNSIRICDPTVGSGFFLITLVNEMIAVKSQLGILADREGNPLFRYKVMADDEKGLEIYDRKNFNPYKFTRTDPESIRIQETLLHEKQIIIENCLFGADIEHINISISSLRLWMELLKHVCWKDEQLQFLPLIDLNLRHGDAMISRCSIQDDLKTIFKRTGYSLMDYKKWSNDLKNSNNRQDRKSITQLISLIQKKLHDELTLDERSHKELMRWQKELDLLNVPGLFELEESDIKALRTRQKEAEEMLDKYKQKVYEARHNPLYKHAIEWRFEFPELLNDSGDFVGFDFVIGNPPDTQNQIFTNTIDAIKHSNYQMINLSGNILSHLIELGHKLLKHDYFQSYIASNTMMKSILADKMHLYLMKDTNPLLLVEFDGDTSFGQIMADQSITLLQKAHNQQRMMTCRIKKDFDKLSASLDNYVSQNATLFMTDKEDSTVSPAFAIISDIEKRIKSQIEQSGASLESWDLQVHTGIRTGCDEAFFIDGKTKDEFILADYKNSDIIKPTLLGENIKRYKPDRLQLWLICIPWHFPLLYDKTIKQASEKAEERFSQQYPVIFRHLQKYRDKLTARNAKEVGVLFEWYAVQNFGINNEWNDFTKPKIVWKRETASPHFYLDYNSCAVMDTTCFVTGQHLKYLLGVLNSKLGHYMLCDSPRLSNGEMHINNQTLLALKIPVPNSKIESEMISLVNKRTSDAYQNDYEDLDKAIDQLVYDVYGLDEEERDFIEANKFKG
ncbi:MAG: hypothetical protein LBE56_10975 [Tannerella sp.]|jgi:hypothetical protein|nr:hypothetical protein [Tannerella sp.]